VLATLLLSLLGVPAPASASHSLTATVSAIAAPTATANVYQVQWQLSAESTELCHGWSLDLEGDGAPGHHIAGKYKTQRFLQ
jgi:hypothetical protein